jgi:hypothetical protein
MKTIFDRRTKEEVLARIDSLTENSRALWGKMSVAQMVRHCSLCEEYYHGNIQVPRSFLGRILGKMAIGAILKNENSTFRKNSSTPASLKVTEDLKNISAEKERWKDLIEKYDEFEDRPFTHWFFGPMTKTQLGQLIYKHSDHHLRQFGV